MKITHIIPDWRELDTYMELAEKYSFNFEYDDFFEPDLLDDKEALEQRIAIYNNLGRERGKDTLHGAFYDIVPFSWDSGIRSHSLYRMQQSMEIAARLGCRGVIFHTGIIPGMTGNAKYRSNWLNVMTDTFKTLLAQDNTLEIYCENMFDASYREIAELAENLQDEKRFGVCLDVAHMMLVTKAPEEWFDSLGSHIRHFHINDNHLEQDEHLAMGQGKIDWKYMDKLMQPCVSDNVSVLLEVKGLDRIRRSLVYGEEFL